jgi:hypothetical protein
VAAVEAVVAVKVLLQPPVIPAQAVMLARQQIQLLLIVLA